MELLRVVMAAEAQQAATVAEPRQPSTAAEPQLAAMVMTATTAVAVAAPSTLLAPAAADSPRAAVVEVPDDDVLPPGWDQWASLPASAPEPPTEALVVRGDDGAALGAQLMVSGPHRCTPPSQLRAALRHVRSKSRSMPARGRPTSSRLKRSRGCGRSSVITALLSTRR
jgi:hypothetical protein